jgi:hypothetical protein
VLAVASILATLTFPFNSEPTLFHSGSNFLQ